MKKITSFLLALALVFSLVPVPAFGQETDPGVSIVSIDGNTVAVAYSTSVPAYLVAAVYAEDGSMLGSGYNVVSPEYRTAWIETNVSPMPSNFTVGVFLLDLSTKAPLCKEYKETFSRSGENITWELSEDGTLTICGTGEMGDYTTVRRPWADVASQVKKVIIENGITRIGNNAFSSCSKLTEAVIPSSVTHIGDRAFFLLSNLKKVTIPNGVTYIGGQAFYQCSSLTDVTIPNSVTHLCGAAFSGCKSLTSVTIPDSVTYLGSSVFFNCSNLASVTISNNVTSLIGQVFRGCTSLTSVTIPNSVTSIGYDVFHGCIDLTNVTIPNSVTEIDAQAFNNCTSLSDVYYTGTMEQWDQIYIANNGNDQLTKATIHCTDGDIAPGSSGEKIVASGVCGQNLKWALNGDGELAISGSGEMVFTDYFAPWYDYRDKIKSVVMQRGITSIEEWAFSGCTNLTSVTIPDSVTSIGEYAIGSYYSQTKIVYGGTMEQWLQIAVDDGNELFSNVNISCKDGDIWLGVPENEIVESGQCGGNLAWTLTGGGALTITGTGEMNNYAPDSWAPWYEQRERVRSVDIQSGAASIGDFAFASCPNLFSVSIPDGVTEIGYRSFMNCPNLSNVTLPKSVNTIHEDAFGFCDSLTSMIIPDGVTEIDWGLFYIDTNLTSVTIPDSVTVIGEHAFFNCYSLSHVFYTGTMAQWAQVAIGGNNDPLSTATIHCTDGDITPANAAMENAVLSIAEELPADSDTETGTEPVTESVTESASAPETEPATESTEDASAVESLPDTAGQCGEDLTWVLNETGTLTISGKGTMEDYSLTSPAPWNGQQAQIKYLTIQTGVLSIGAHAFENCTGLTTVTIPASVTSIGEYAFSGCAQLSDVYYGGAMEQWQQFGIDCGNAAIHCTDSDIAPGDIIVTTEPSTESTTETTEPNTEPVTEPVTEPATEPATEPVTEPVTEPAAEPETEPATEPATESSTAPVNEPVAEPATAPETEPEAAPAEEVLTVEPLSNIQWFSLPEGVTMTVLPVLQPLAVFTGTEGASGNVHSVRFTGLKPGEACVLIVSTVPGSLEPQNLQYIDQNNAAPDGSLSFNYIPREDVEAIVQLYSVPNEQNADVNSDGKIDVDDVFYLAMHISAPTIFPIPWQSADVNSDGTVNVDDVFYLAMHISAPAIFPLFPQPAQAL